jgi:hypothetical protein
LLLEKSSKSLIPLSDCPFVLNRLPVFLENLPVFGEKTGLAGPLAARGQQPAIPVVGYFYLGSPEASMRRPITDEVVVSSRSISPAAE